LYVDLLNTHSSFYSWKNLTDSIWAKEESSSLADLMIYTIPTIVGDQGCRSLSAQVAQIMNNGIKHRAPSI